MSRSSTGGLALVLGAAMLAAGCGKSVPGGKSASDASAPAEQPVATTPAEGGWVTFEFPEGGFTVEVVATPKYEPPFDSGPLPEDASGLGESKIYRARGAKFSTDAVVAPMMSPDESPEAAVDFNALVLTTNVPGATSRKIAHAGVPGLEQRFPARGAGPMIYRVFYRNGKEITLQFNIHEKVDESAFAAERDRFFHSLRFSDEK